MDNWQGSAKKRKLLKEVLLDVCIKCTVWKAEHANNRKNRVYLVYIRKTTQKGNPCCCIRKNCIFPTPVETGPHKILGCLTARGVHAGQLPKCLHIRDQHPNSVGTCSSYGMYLSLKAHWTWVTLYPAEGSLGLLEPKCFCLLKGEHCPMMFSWQLHNAAPCSTQMAKNLTVFVVNVQLRVKIR